MASEDRPALAYAARGPEPDALPAHDGTSTRRGKLFQRGTDAILRPAPRKIKITASNTVVPAEGVAAGKTIGLGESPAVDESAKRPARRAAAEEILELLELEPYRLRRAGELPYGIQKLVGVARALAMEPRLLLLDEPSSGMSRQEKEDLARFMLRIRHEKPMSIVWVEHDIQMVRDLADRVVVLDYGRKIFDGPPEQALQDPGVVQAYLGRPVLTQ